MEILRWIFFIPAGILAGTFLQLFWPIFIDKHAMNSGVIFLIAAILAGAAVVYVSVKVAPTKRKFEVSLCICILLLIGTIFAVLNQIKFEEATLYETLLSILQLLGGLIVTYEIRKNNL